MKNILFLILACVSLNAQVKKTLSESVSGSYATVKAGEQLVLSINSQNRFDYKNYYFSINPMYNVTYVASNVSSSEFLTKQDLGIKITNYSVFIINQYDSSLIRSISYDEWHGIGFGKKFNITQKFITSLSYCFEQQIREYSHKDKEEIFRNSIRLKSGITYQNISLQLEYYYQPAFNIKDVNVLGSAMIIILPNKPVNFIIQNTCSYMSTDPVKMIQNTTFGIKFNLK